MQIKLNNIHKTYKSKNSDFYALKGCTLDIEQGSITGIIGKSGAGKSTLLRCINGLENFDKGDILFEGKSIPNMTNKELCNIRHKMGMIFQYFNLLKRRTVLENICFPLELVGYNKEKILNRAHECLRLVGLEDKQNSYPSELSGGQAQRVGIARAIALEPLVLLCDEATSALDPQTTQDILKLLFKLNQTLGLTIVFITHEISIVRDICTHVAVMEEGEIVESGTVEKVFIEPEKEPTKKLIHSLFNSTIPPLLQENLQQINIDLSVDYKKYNIVLRLIFSKNNSDKPIIYDLIKNTNVAINIAGGSLDHLGMSTYGTLFVTMSYNTVETNTVKEYLESHGVKVDILGYIQ